jgi:N-acetylneuraminate synthase/N,N'-diacetyllegionaminate synthase
MMIGERAVSADQPCYVIAEIGVNHNGDLELARALIDAAAASGADAAKFQTFRTDALVTRGAAKADYQKLQTGAGSQAEMLAGLELPMEAFAVLRDYCAAVGIDFISSAFDLESLETVISLKPPCLKWPSGELTNWPLLAVAASSRLPIILSTGMAQFDEVAAAVDFLERQGAEQFAILQCVSNYPAPLAEQNLRCIATMAQVFARPTGFSDHTQGPWAAIAARGLGMAILEKHITLDSAMAGPDHAASAEPSEFADMVRLLRQVEVALGDGIKRPTPSEMPTREAARKSLVYVRDLAAGHLLAAADLTAKRPGGGASPDKAELFIGRTLACGVSADAMLEPGDLR